jgi:hypothetical protein
MRGIGLVLLGGDTPGGDGHMLFKRGLLSPQDILQVAPETERIDIAD